MAPGIRSSICKEVLESQPADHELSIASDELETFQLTKSTIAPSIKGGVSSTNAVNELLKCPVCTNSMYPPIHQEYLLMFQRFVSKILTLCVPTIAVIRGHVVGMGCIFALAHDYRLMASNYGYIFMNEVDFGLPFTLGNVNVLQLKLKSGRHFT
ncbi:uncharacterized protein LOC131250651 [Magnolia sinica]|uniref:uncharacterized protein LOC131250651 n=1 Tax=Magnolia sinica TaxID=86752 RepID=UPI00265AFC43|nr:uncharacterized protein LOC131250651 [Magnolia sinica]